MINICGTYDEDIYCKFKKNGEKYYNERMLEEAEKRSKYCESRRKNRKKEDLDDSIDISTTYEEDMNDISKTYVPHMENRNENINEDIDIDKKGVIGGKEFVDTSESKLPAKSKKVFDLEELNPFDRVWEKWKRFKKTQFKFSYKTEESEAIGKKHLFDMSKGLADLAEMIVDNAIAKGYKGLFPLDGTGGQKMDKTDRNKATTMGALKILEAKMANNEI